MEKDGAAELPQWLTEQQDYEATYGRRDYLDKSLLSLASLLAYFRLNSQGRLIIAPSPLLKLVGALAIILLNSLSHNFAFTVLLLALVLMRVSTLRAEAFRMSIGVAAGATALSFLLMLPAVFLGQAHSAVLIAGKTLVSTALVMCVATTTPQSDITATLRRLHLSEVVVTTFDLAIKAIISLGETAIEITTALKLRSVGKPKDKSASMGGVGGTLLLKSKEEADVTYEAMLCRCYDSGMHPTGEGFIKASDALWIFLFAVLLASFVYFQGAV